MSPLADALVDQFGSEGLRRLDHAVPAELGVSEDATELLTGAGLPARVGVYFTAPGPNDRPTIPVGEDEPGWLRLGTDHGAQLAVAPDGKVRALPPSADWGPTRPVNDSVEQFVGSLIILDRYLPILAKAAQRDGVGEVWKHLRDALAEIDPPVSGEPDGWWSRVLEDIRHTVSFPFSAAVKVVPAGGPPRILTASAALGLPHPELQLADRLAADRIDRNLARELFTELEACRTPGHYCAMRARGAFPRARYTYALPYRDDADERERSVIAAAQRAADAAAG